MRISRKKSTHIHIEARRLVSRTAPPISAICYDFADFSGLLSLNIMYSVLLQIHFLKSPTIFDVCRASMVCRVSLTSYKSGI